MLFTNMSVQANQCTPVVSCGNGYNQLAANDSSAVTWSIMTDIGGDLPCSPNFNDSLNRLSPVGEIHYTINGSTYTTKKVDPYTAIQTNDITKQQRTLKSSVCALIAFSHSVSFSIHMSNAT